MCESSYCFQRILAIAVLSVHPSDCPSVRPSHGWISQKQCKLGSPNLHRWLLGSAFGLVAALHCNAVCC